MIVVHVDSGAPGLGSECGTGSGHGGPGIEGGVAGWVPGERRVLKRAINGAKRKGAAVMGDETTLRMGFRERGCVQKREELRVRSRNGGASLGRESCQDCPGCYQMR